MEQFQQARLEDDQGSKWSVRTVVQQSTSARSRPVRGFGRTSTFHPPNSQDYGTDQSTSRTETYVSPLMLPQLATKLEQIWVGHRHTSG
jgi:hypothetical protein